MSNEPTPEDLALDLSAALATLRPGARGVIGAALRRAIHAEQRAEEYLQMLLRAQAEGFAAEQRAIAAEAEAERLRALVSQLTPDLTATDAIRHALQEEMSDLSEDEWCADWLIDCEFIFWQAIQDQADWCTWQRVKALSDLAGGWWHWPREAEEAVFVSLDEWSPVYERWAEHRKATEAQWREPDDNHA